VLAPALRRARRNAERLRDLVVTSDLALAVARYAEGKRPALTAKLVREVERCWTRSRPAASFRTHGHGRGARRPDCLLCILARLGAKRTSTSAAN
jgi:hypothetical protein